MRWTFIGLLILGTATFAQAIDFGGLLDTIEKGASSTQGDQDTQSGTKKDLRFRIWQAWSKEPRWRKKLRSVRNWRARS